MLESSLCAEDQFCHLHFTGSFWDGACYFVIYTLQGLFGMVPAMYVDLAPDRNSCIWTPSMWLTLPHVVSMEVMVVLVIILVLIRGCIF